ncbi:MAG TPA: hypothetical protein VFW64_04260 [Pseudonocardiaceae bacterium]|nr:hypothetical protein [Pseudonocardiaceae bacterium]
MTVNWWQVLIAVGGGLLLLLLALLTTFWITRRNRPDQATLSEALRLR